jgi:hypothetical protein
VSLLAQAVGSAVILAAFAAGQFGLAGTSSYFYLAANVIGSLALAVSALLSSQWGFLVLEGVWCAVSTFSICKSLVRSRAERDKDATYPQSVGRTGATAAKD